MRLALAGIGLALGLGCAPVYPDDTGMPADSGAAPTTGPTTPSGDTDSHTDTDTDDTAPQDLTGSWRSEGDGIAPLLAADPFDWVLATATFDGHGTYAASAMDGQGAAYPVAGTYTVDTSTLPGTIELHQTEGGVLTAVGIWQVDGDTLTYEVVQTVPDYGLVPPTPDGGFGSSSGAGLQPGDVVQVYERT